MKSKPVLLLLALPLGTALAQNQAAVPAPATTQVSPSAPVTPGSILAAQLATIVETKDLGEDSKRRQMAAAIRLAIATALTKVTEPQQAGRIIVELAQAAAAAVPQYGDLVFRTFTTTAQDVPVLAHQTGLAEALRAAIVAAVSPEGAGNEQTSRQRTGSQNGNDQGQNNDHQGNDGDHVVSPSH